MVCKILISAAKMLGKRGSATPGKIALMIAPDILRRLASQVRRGIIVVCGTNGKTTTNNMIYDLLSAKGYKLVCNRLGANMLYGAVTAFIDAAGINGKLDADYACIEADELWAVKMFEHFKPDYIVMTNLFRDQLDRYGQVEIILDALKRAAEAADGATLIVNADDPLLVTLGKGYGGKCVYYGVDDEPREIAAEAGSAAEIREGRLCRSCGAELKYEAYYYSHIGRYACPDCGFSRPAPEYAATGLDLSRGLAFNVGGEQIRASYRGFYNVYNILAAYAVLRQCGVDTAGINETLANFRPQLGRMETFTIGGKEVFLNLAKNPAGFNQAISALLADERAKTVLLAVNDHESDGRDVSWLWDVDFERLRGVDKIIASGARAADILVRMKYAGFGPDRALLDPGINEGVASALSGDSEAVYALVNYTALFSTHDLLRKMAKGSP